MLYIFYRNDSWQGSQEGFGTSFEIQLHTHQGRRTSHKNQYIHAVASDDWDPVPKYIYHIKYLDGSYPVMFGGYPSHAHYDPFLDIAETSFDLYQYEYPGQAWHFGSLAFKFFAAFIVPLCLYWRLRTVHEQKVEKGMVGFGDPHNHWGEGAFQFGRATW
jgi:hypothetical protein